MREELSKETPSYKRQQVNAIGTELLKTLDLPSGVEEEGVSIMCADLSNFNFRNEWNQ